MSIPLAVLDPGSYVFWLHAGTAVLCGTTIGLERQLRGKAAGVRTSILICLGTQLFVAIGTSFDPAHADPTRVLGQVITGIGFIGGGVILARESLVFGVTSAAVIWMLAALGSLIGLGYLYAAIILTLITLAVLLGVEGVESVIASLRRGAVARGLDELDVEQ